MRPSTTSSPEERAMRFDLSYWRGECVERGRIDEERGEKNRGRERERE